MSGLRFAHVSDLHLPFAPRLSLAQRFSKRQLSAWSWQRRQSLHRPEILEALVADVAAQAVDHVLVTGDIVNFALPEEFARAAEWLAALAPPDRLSLVPGNHDTLVGVAAAQGLGAWERWTHAAAGWPALQRHGGVSLIGVNSGLPTAPLLAQGRIGGAQLERLERLLESEGAAGQLRWVMLHHPPADGVVRWRKALADRAALRAVLRRAGAELVLHGHARDARLDVVPGPRQPIPCLCVPSSSAVPSRHDQGARWHRLTLSGTPARPRVDVQVRRWSVDHGAFEPDHAYALALPGPAADPPAGAAVAARRESAHAS